MNKLRRNRCLCTWIVALFAIAAAFISETDAQKAIGCIATMPADPRARWEFDEPRFNTTMYTSVFDTMIDGQTRRVSVMVGFCSQVGLILGDALQDDPQSWMGWSYGQLFEFDYNEIQPIVRPPGSAPRPPTVAAPAIDVDTEREFTQIYRHGDKGWPCRRSEGRTAYIHIWCDDDNDATCLDIPGATSPHCADNSTLPSAAPCICSVSLDLDNDPCTLVVNVLMHQCPDRSLIPLSPSTPTPSAPQGPTGGEVFGIIVLVLFLIAIATFVGGYAYNYAARGLRGVEALPFYAFCAASPQEDYQPAPTLSANYGSTVSSDA